LQDLRDDRACRVIVLTGAGDGFCAGLDLKEGVKLPDLPGLGRATAGMRVQQYIANLIPLMRSQPQPIIAAVNGAASGGGLALTLGSDIRIAAGSARFNVAFIKVGLSACDIGTSWILPRLIGASRAYELMLTGRFVDSDEALRIGLVTSVVPDAELQEAAIAEAERIGLVTSVVADDALLDAAYAEADLILSNGPFGVRMTKEVMWSQLEIGSLQAGIDLENRTQVLASFAGDLQEAMAAFAEKRPPQFED
jgi:enoyl-CoA hydratase